MSEPTVEFSLVTESFNLAAGTALEPLYPALSRAASAARESEVAHDANGEVLLADVDGRPQIDDSLKDFPAVRKIPCHGLSYDAAINRAAASARGEYVALAGPSIRYQPLS